MSGGQRRTKLTPELYRHFGKVCASLLEAAKLARDVGCTEDEFARMAGDVFSVQDSVDFDPALADTLWPRGKSS